MLAAVLKYRHVQAMGIYTRGATMTVVVAVGCWYADQVAIDK